MKHRRDKVVVAYEPRTAEDKAFYAYYPKGHGFSYQWTGNPNDPVEVAQDEQVVAVIRTWPGTDQPLGDALAAWQQEPAFANLGLNYMAHAMCHWYEHFCDEWINHLTQGGAEPQWVTVDG